MAGTLAFMGTGKIHTGFWWGNMKNTWKMWV
jgi:hypothetical protein